MELEFYCSQDEKTVSVEPSGHHWPGLARRVTPNTARHSLAFEYGYVSDEVLDKYEQNDIYTVYSHSGSVYYGNRWCISNCDRVGRNAIRVELKKLYEGTPAEVINFWHKFAIDPRTIDECEPHIATLSKRLLTSYFLFAELLTKQIQRFLATPITPEELISYSKVEAERVGLLQYPEFIKLSHHVSADHFSKDQFLTRCKTLLKILIENISERLLRRIVTAMGFDSVSIQEFRSLKLLDMVLRFLYTAHASGLNPLSDANEIRTRIDQMNELKIIDELFALNSIRQLDAHRIGTNSSAKLNNALGVFGIDKVMVVSSYGRACDQVYLRIEKMFSKVNRFLEVVEESEKVKAR